MYAVNLSWRERVDAMLKERENALRELKEEKLRHCVYAVMTGGGELYIYDWNKFGFTDDKSFENYVKCVGDTDNEAVIYAVHAREE